MDLIVERQDGTWQARWGGERFPCAIGRGGITSRKREGDGATPVGAWPLGRLFYRPDRERPPASALPARALTPLDGWCDDSSSAAYNRLVRLPCAARHERLWRDDSLYNLLVTLGYNETPPRPFAGSAIFLHLARPDFAPTEGCVALARSDLLKVLRGAGAGSRVVVRG